MSYKKQNFKGKDKGKNSATEVVIQQPGEVIVPEVADGIVEKIAEEVNIFFYSKVFKGVK